MYEANIPIPAKRITDFENLGLGMFVHYGLYSMLENGEWIYWMTDRNMDEYKKLADKFTAKDFDAEKIVLTAKRAGCKYVTFTTRHHDGFSLYDTKGLCEFNSLNSPCGRDLVREFVDACNKYDIVPFLYHTTWDWYQKSFEQDFNSYLEYLRQSVEVLCTNYGKIGGLWFDGNWIKRHADWKLDELYGTIRKYQPDAIIINNTGLQARGEVINPEIDVVTFEQGNCVQLDRDGVPKYLAGEACVTLNTHWGYAKNDFNYKSPAELIHIICESRTTGNNILINVGPDGDGAIPPYQVALMDMIGQWVDIFGESIYDVEPLFYPDNPSSISNTVILRSRKEKAYYLFNFDLGKIGNSNVTVSKGYAGIIAFSNVKAKIDRIEWIDTKEELTFTQGEDNSLSVNFTGYKYGTDFTMRVAKAYLR